MKKTIYGLLGSSMILLFLFAGCGKQEKPVAQQTAPEIAKAIAVIHGLPGNEQIHGTATFTKVEGGIRVVADIEGLTPGEHGFHIHQYGSCGGQNASAAGGHFNPEGKAHGAPTAKEHHVGDLGNIEAVEGEVAHVEWTDADLAFSGSHSILGRAVIIHQDPDDYKSQPSGNAGPRIACGVIGIASNPIGK